MMYLCGAVDAAAITVSATAKHQDRFAAEAHAALNRLMHEAVHQADQPDVSEATPEPEGCQYSAQGRELRVCLGFWPEQWPGSGMLDFGECNRAGHERAPVRRRSATVTFRYNPLDGDTSQHKTQSARACTEVQACLNRKLRGSRAVPDGERGGDLQADLCR
ncbi:hypothetical protein, partial [Nonomuraea insulae]